MDEVKEDIGVDTLLKAFIAPKPRYTSTFLAGGMSGAIGISLASPLVPWISPDTPREQGLVTLALSALCGVALIAMEKADIDKQRMKHIKVINAAIAGVKGADPSQMAVLTPEQRFMVNCARALDMTDDFVTELRLRQLRVARRIGWFDGGTQRANAKALALA